MGQERNENQPIPLSTWMKVDVGGVLASEHGDETAEKTIVSQVFNTEIGDVTASLEHLDAAFIEKPNAYAWISRDQPRESGWLEVVIAMELSGDVNAKEDGLKVIVRVEGKETRVFDCEDYKKTGENTLPKAWYDHDRELSKLSLPLEAVKEGLEVRLEMKNLPMRDDLYLEDF